MVSISKSTQAYKVFVTRNAEGFKIRDCGDFTFKDGYRPKCPTCGHKMNKDGFAQKPKVIDYFGTADRQPAINDVTVIIQIFQLFIHRNQNGLNVCT